MSRSERSRHQIVLLVDNHTSTLDSWSSALAERDYTVLSASSYEEALTIAKSHWFHLLVIDARLHNDDDPLDYSGIQLVRHEQLEIYPRIIYTAYPDHTINRLIQEMFGQLPPGVRVYSKRDYDIGTIVDSAFQPARQGGTGQVGINFDQRLIYNDDLSTLSLVGRLRDVPLDGETIMARIGEIEDLFGKAFANCETLRITPITSGRGGGFVLIVTPEQDQQPQRSQIVKCGERQIIAREHRNHQDHVRPFVNFAAHLTEERPIETLHFGLLQYQITFGDIDETLTFAEFYRRNTSASIRQAIWNLFERVLAPWQRGSAATRSERGSLCRFYEDRLLFRGRSQAANLANMWDAVGNAIRDAIRDTPAPIGIRARNGVLSWVFGDRTIELPEPHSYLAAIRGGQSPLFGDSYLACRCHGDLHVENIRVTDDALTYLIDFEYTGWGPLLQDAVELESSILLGMIADRRLDHLLLLIETLADQSGLDEPLALPAPLRDAGELAKALEILGVLRAEAGRIEGALMADYLLGLVYHALRMIISERPPSWADMRKLAFYKTVALFLASACCRALDRLAAAETGESAARGI
jgi:CheY-like chemotaxis protein